MIGLRFPAARLAACGAALLALVLVCAAAPPAGAAAVDEPGEAPRGAFVIGNQAYANFEPLKNAVNDARLIAASLKRLNFQVIEGYDLSLAGMQALFDNNRDLLSRAEAVTFYYAGHGFQIAGKNYLVPVDAELRSAAAIASSTVRLDAVIAALQSPTRPTLILLDACRNNPLPPSVELDDRANGLAQIEAAENTFIAFATQPGNVSNDGVGENSPFATALARNLETPGLSISDLVIAVRNETRELTLGQQSPWDQSSLLAQFYFTERQHLDEGALIAAASQITQDDRLRAEFLRARDEGLSFQAAVFRAKQRAVEVLGLPSAAPVDLYPGSQQNIVVASTEPSGTVRQDGFSVVEELMFLRPDQPAAPVDPASIETERRRDLARSVQTELQRLGCYRMAIDGAWGPGSRNALRDYVSATGQTATALEPSLDWLRKLSLESGRICRAPVIIQRPPAARQAPVTASVPPAERQQPSFKRRAPQGQSREAQRERRDQRREALPPDLSMGVGIGL
jgi:hypothetical protein